MTVTPLARLDLNLLVALRELIRERNVTHAAERLGVTQPAVSATLRRLRRHFDDELLVRRGSTYVLTPLAAQLSEQVEALCTAVERVFDTPIAFDPRTTRREFSLVLADYTVAVLGGLVTRDLAAAAPHARLHIRTVKEELTADIAQTLRVTDGLVAPATPWLDAEGFGKRELFRDRWVCVVDAANQAVGARPTRAALARLEWSLPYHNASRGVASAPASAELEMLGIRPRVAVRVDSYQAAAQLVAGTARVALVQQRLLPTLPPSPALRAVPCPGPPHEIVECLWWDRCFDGDPAHEWFRALVAGAAARLTGP